MSDKVPAILQGLATLRASLKPVPKSHKNTGQGFMFRSIEDVLNVLPEAMEKAQVVHDIKIISYQQDANSGGKGYHYTVLSRVTVASLVDGSERSFEFVGEGNDFGDKAAAKAMSCALKYFCIHGLLAPTVPSMVADNDRESPEAAPVSDFRTKFYAQRKEG